MKVLALVIFSVAAVSGLGSGPYLPSGWKPQGPAFYLPSEVQKPAENPLKDTILQESEASGSDALREYGPPKVSEVSQDLTSQALPDAVTEQAFVVIQAKFSDGEAKEEGEVTVEEAAQVKDVEEVSQVILEEAAQAKELEEVAVTEAVDSQVTSEEKTTEAVTEAVETTAAVEFEAIQEKSIDADVTAEINEATTETAQTTVVTGSTEDSLKAEEDSNVESTQVEQVSQVQEVEERTVGVKNVAEALENLDKVIKAQVQTSEDTVELKSVQVISQEAPEGFLEYGPPGFREYGPPQGDELARPAAVQQSEEEQKIENNEARRRRFSPKFRSSKKY